MKVKLIDVRDLSLLYNKIKNQKMPIKTAYKFNKLMEAVDKELSFFQEKLNKILDEYAEKDENGEYVYSTSDSIKIQDNKLQACQEELLALQSFEVEITSSVFDLDELDSLDISVDDLRILMPFIAE